MNTLIIPCAGRSSRFPGMKPKYLLTHPDGKLMIEKSLEHLNTDIFDRIIITIVKPHDEEYEAGLILRQVFCDNPRVELCILDDFTSSASETVYRTIVAMGVRGSLVIKDADNAVGISLPQNIKNMIVGYDISVHKGVPNIPGKSFLVVNEQNIVQDIIEKQIVSNIICIGVYCFRDASIFCTAYEELHRREVCGEMYISHVISYVLSHCDLVFEAVQASYYADWGSLEEWKRVQQNFRTYFIDWDGVLMKNTGKYGSLNWNNNSAIISQNMKVVADLQKRGAQIVITTSRTEEFKGLIEEILEQSGVKPFAILVGMHHAGRVLINDFAPTNSYPSAQAISLPRNSFIQDYLN